MSLYRRRKFETSTHADFPVHPFAGAFGGDVSEKTKNYMKAIKESDDAKFAVVHTARRLGGSLALDGAGVAAIGAGMAELASGDPIVGAIVGGVGAIATSLMTSKSLKVFEDYSSATRQAVQAKANLAAIEPQVRTAP